MRAPPCTSTHPGQPQYPHLLQAVDHYCGRVMIVMPGPDLLAGRHVITAAGPLACGGMHRDHEAPLRGYAKLFCHRSITVGFPPHGEHRPALGQGSHAVDTDTASGLLQEKVGALGGVVGIEESPEMAAVARERIAGEGRRNVTVVQSPAEDADIAVTADAALFCTVHDILQSPDALGNVMTKLRPGALCVPKTSST